MPAVGIEQWRSLRDVDLDRSRDCKRRLTDWKKPCRVAASWLVRISLEDSMHPAR